MERSDEPNCACVRALSPITKVAFSLARIFLATFNLKRLPFSLRTKGKGLLLPLFYELFQNLILLELTTRNLSLSSQAHGVHTEGEVVYVPFPLDCKYGEGRKYT